MSWMLQSAHFFLTVCGKLMASKIFIKKNQLLKHLLFHKTALRAISFGRDAAIKSWEWWGWQTTTTWSVQAVSHRVIHVLNQRHLLFFSWPYAIIPACHWWQVINCDIPPSPHTIIPGRGKRVKRKVKFTPIKDKDFKDLLWKLQGLIPQIDLVLFCRLNSRKCFYLKLHSGASWPC